MLPLLVRYAHRFLSEIWVGKRKISGLEPLDMKKTSQSQRLRGFSCICKGFLAYLFAHYLRYLQVIDNVQ